MCGLPPDLGNGIVEALGRAAGAGQQPYVYLILEASRTGPARQAVESAYREQLLQNQLLESIRRTGRF